MTRKSDKKLSTPAPMPVEEMLKHFNPEVLKAIADPDTEMEVTKDRIILRVPIRDSK